MGSIRLLCMAAIIFGHSFSTNANRMEDIKFMRHCGEMSPAECNETLEMARGRCITEEEYQTGKQSNRTPWCLNGVKFLSWCSCSCFSMDTRLLAKTEENPKWFAFGEDYDSRFIHQFATMDSNASLSNIILDWRNLSAWSSGPEKKPLIVIKTDKGQKLSVTGGHAMLLDSGEMVFAETLQVGQRLVTSEGISVKISTLESQPTSSVYNVLTNGKSLMSHLIFAEGLIVGDLAWENSLYSEMGRVLIRQ